MAKAKQIPCKTGDDARGWLTKVLAARFDEVIDHAPAALHTEGADGVDGIHDMRVAARRYRSVLRDFEDYFDKLPLKSVRKDLKKLSDLLGSVRDRDVAIIALETLAGEQDDEETAKAVERLIAEYRTARVDAHHDLLLTFPLEAVKALRDSLTDAIGQTMCELESTIRERVEATGRKIIAERLNKVSKFGSVLYDPDDNEGLHKLRLRCKRLRYALELFAACLGDDLIPFAKEIAKLQKCLGELHDCDVWIDSLGERLKGLAGKTDDDAADRAAAEWLLSEFAEKRSEAYRAALDRCGEWEAKEFVDELRSNISRD
jgi:CHAD domain-containing protein